MRRPSGWFHRSTLLPLALAGVALAACSSTPPVASAGRACPQVVRLRDAATVTSFRPGPGRDRTDVAARAVIADFAGTCTYDPSGVQVELDVVLEAERGPALPTSSTGYSYFVAVVDPARNVLARQAFPVEFSFGDGPAVRVTEPLTQRIPLPANVDARSYEIMVGFVLDADQLAWNRSRTPSDAATSGPSVETQAIPTTPAQPAPAARSPQRRTSTR